MRTPIRILVLTSMFPPHHYGGYELICEDVVTRWRDTGHDVDVLTTTMRLDAVEDPLNERANGVRRDLDFYFRDSLIVRPKVWHRLRIEKQNQRALAAALDEVRPDVVSVWHMGAMSMGLLTTLARRGVPMVMVIGDLWPVYGPLTDAWTSLFTRRRWAARAAERLTGLPTTLDKSAGGAAWCFASDWLRRLVLAESSFEPARYAVVHHGVDLDTFTPAHGGRRGWQWRLACVGRLDDRKGVHFAVRALPLLPAEATLTITGRGDPAYVEQLREEGIGLGVADRVSFGASPRSELHHRYAEADVLVFTPTWEEPFGLVPLEAMACGTPVVATATGGSTEFLVDGANCVIVPKSDERAIAAAVARIAGDQDLRGRLVAGGLATANLFGVDRLAAALDEWHIAAIAQFRDGVPSEAPTARAELERRGLA